MLVEIRGRSDWKDRMSSREGKKKFPRLFKGGLNLLGSNSETKTEGGGEDSQIWVSRRRKRVWTSRLTDGCK